MGEKFVLLGADYCSFYSVQPSSQNAHLSNTEFMYKLWSYCHFTVNVNNYSLLIPERATGCGLLCIIFDEMT